MCEFVGPMASLSIIFNDYINCIIKIVIIGINIIPLKIIEKDLQEKNKTVTANRNLVTLIDENRSKYELGYSGDVQQTNNKSRVAAPATTKHASKQRTGDHEPDLPVQQVTHQDGRYRGQKSWHQHLYNHGTQSDITA